MNRTTAPILGVLLGTFSLAGCGTDEAFDQESSRLAAEFSVRESVEQLHVSHAGPGVELSVQGPSGGEIARGRTDELGSLVFRALAPGDGYRVREVESGRESRKLVVLSPSSSARSQEFYSSQVLTPGYQYIETRDGTTLSVYITLPGPIEDGPYPTIVNYSGYEPSRPGGPLELGLPQACDAFPTLCDAPNHPSGMIGGLLGFATVGVNMRGTGCSGGAYDFFETLQLLDGYDVIETVAAQTWVLHNKVGMAGLSYPGISQLFVARTRPPGLAAITPLSVIADTASSTLLPGGIFNDGFALSWAENVLNGAAPYGQGWEQARVDEGDETCEENQLLHGQAVDTVAKALNTPFRTPEVNDAIDPSLFVHEIDVPVFLTGAWQDEQTGGHFPALFDRFDSAPVAKFSVFNGDHADGYTPHIISEWKTFLDLYVARRIPSIDPLIRGAAPLLFQELFGASLDLGPDRFADYPTYESAREAYEAEDSLRVIFEVGARAGGTPHAPEGTFERRFSEWPVPGIEARRYYLQPDGTLADKPPTTDDNSGSSFNLNPAVSRQTSLAGGSPGDIEPRWTWTTPAPGEAITFETPVLDSDLVFLGHASADLWLRSTAADADLEVNVTEIRSDGAEVYVQSGWLRASQRALAEDATELRPTKTHREVDAADLPQGEWELVRVEVFPFGHVFRTGSRIRMSVETPGGNRPEWTFILNDLGPNVVHSVAHSAAHPSSIVFSHLPGIEPSVGNPTCSLRGQPCRPYEPLGNSSFKP